MIRRLTRTHGYMLAMVIAVLCSACATAGEPPVNGELKRVGSAYAARLRLDAQLPDGLGGDRTAAWHQHHWCRDPSLGGRPIIGVTPNECEARGGTPLPRKTVMVHVWTDVPNPEGPYGHDNPALPFLATGLEPPSAHDFHAAARARMARALGMALGETYDYRLPIAREVERDNTDLALAEAVRTHRAAIAELIPSLREAEAAGDRGAYDRVAGLVIGEWELLRQLHERMAATPELRERLRREHEAVPTMSAHHRSTGGAGGLAGARGENDQPWYDGPLGCRDRLHGLRCLSSGG